MRRAYLSLSIILILAILALGQAEDEDEYVKQGWVLKKSGEPTIYNRERPDSPIKELLMIFYVDAAPIKVFKVLCDLENFKEFMPYTVVSEVLKRTRQNDKEIVYFFTILDLPKPISNRYYTIKLINEPDPNGKKGAYRSAWNLSDDPALDPKPDAPRFKGIVDPKYYNCIKTAKNMGYWLVEPKGDGSKVTYYVYTDPGGVVPAWAANMANSIAAPKLANAVKERVKLPQYER